MSDTTKEVLFGCFWAAVTVVIVVFVLGLDWIPESPDYFIGVVR